MILNLVNHFDLDYWQKWHSKNWLICFWFAFLYIIAVQFGLNFMKDRKPYKLRLPLAVWSGMLGVFSMAVSFAMVPELLSVLYKNGFGSACCDNSFVSDKNVIFWSWLFVWSKVLEFGDTAFIILRKQKLTFLHWYHHAMTVICVFTYFPGMIPINRWTGSMNYFIHSIMYTYYCFKALGFKLPRLVSVIITTLQILQMFIGLYVSSYCFAQKLAGLPCKITLNESIFCFTIYFTYLILFLNFFIRTYLNRYKAKKVV